LAKEFASREKGFRYRKTLNVVPECIQNILENGAEEGSRNITIACLTSFYRESGKTFEEIVDLMTEWNSKNTKPTPNREMKATIKSIFYGNKTYGCSTLQTITHCNKSDCKLIKTKVQSKKRRNTPHAIRID
jgi:DNA primase large subunit